MKKIKVGLAGVSGRGSSFKSAVDAVGILRIQAVCDIDEKTLKKAKALFKAEEGYSDYGEMIKKADIDAVLISTPMPLHVSQSITAVEKGIHVLSEVPAGVSVAECKKLVKAVKKSGALYMMAENANYHKYNMVVKELARKGLFGEVYYAEGEYIHELKELNEITRWRRKWQTGINGITYGTHCLGPVLDWMEGDRVVSVCCAGSGHHYRDPRGKYYENEDSCTMLCRMARGGMVKVRVDMLSNRPSITTAFALQGTDGCYESARARHETGKVWLGKKSKDAHTWIMIDALEKEFLPRLWKRYGKAAEKAGHCGSDFFELLDFAEAIRDKKPSPIDIHRSMDMTIPCIVSQESIARGSKWLSVPDSRDWE